MNLSVLLHISITLLLCLHNVLSRPEPDLKLQLISSVGGAEQARKGKSWPQGSNRIPSLGFPNGVVTPRWGSSGGVGAHKKEGGVGALKKEGGIRSPGSHPAIPLNQLSPEKQVIFLEKFSLLNPVQQAFAYNQFFSTAPDVQTFAINQFIELDSDLLIRSIQAELERVAEVYPKELEIVLAGARPELKFNPALVVKLPIGRVCRDQQWIDGRGVRTLYRDCESGFVYNINTNIHFDKGPVTPEGPSTVRPPTGTPPTDSPDEGSGNETTDIPETTTLNPENPSTGIPPVDPPCEELRSTSESGDCPANWFKCDSGDTCIPKCRR